MKILRVFNNNVVLAHNGCGEVIVTGRGIGFKARPGDEIERARISRVFAPTDGRDPDHLAELMANIPLDFVTLVSRAVDAVGLDEQSRYSPTLIMALADHVYFATQRADRGEHLAYPLLGEVKAFYSKEYSQAQAIVEYLNAQLKKPLPESEAVAVTLHLVGAGFANGNLSATYQMTGIIQQLISIIESSFEVSLNHSTTSVGRFITHLRYLFVRIADAKQLAEKHPAIREAVRGAEPEAYHVAQQLAGVIELRLGAELTEEEITYLTLHVARTVAAAKEAQTPKLQRTQQS